MGRLVKQRSSDSKDISYGWAAFWIWATVMGLWLLGRFISSLY